MGHTAICNNCLAKSLRPAHCCTEWVLLLGTLCNCSFNPNMFSHRGCKATRSSGCSPYLANNAGVVRPLELQQERRHSCRSSAGTLQQSLKAAKDLPAAANHPAAKERESKMDPIQFFGGLVTRVSAHQPPFTYITTTVVHPRYWNFLSSISRLNEIRDIYLEIAGHVFLWA